MGLLKYEHKAGDENYFYIIALPLVPIILPLIYYFGLIIEKFNHSKTTIRKLFYPLFVIAALLPGITIPILTVVTYDSWIVSFISRERYIDKLSRKYYVVESPELYSYPVEVTRETISNYLFKGYKILGQEESQDWYERQEAWASYFFNPLYLIGWAIGLNIPLLLVYLLENWVVWIAKKETPEKIEEYDNAA